MKALKIILLIIAAALLFMVGYQIGKNHVIMTQEIEIIEDGYLVIIDGDGHLYS